MQIKKLKTGVAYEYSTSNNSQFGSKGAMFVLSTDTYKTVRRPLPTELPFVPCPSGKAGYMEDAGILVILFRNMGWSAVAEQAAKILSTVTLEQVEAHGMQIPAAVQRKLDKLDGSIEASLTVVLPRYLRGEWDELAAQEKARKAQAQEVYEQVREEAAERKARWAEVARVVEALTGDKMFGHRSWVPEGPAESVRLTDIEALVAVAKAALPLLRAEDVQSNV